MGTRKEFASPEELEAAPPPIGITDIEVPGFLLRDYHESWRDLFQMRLELDLSAEYNRALGQELVERKQRGEDAPPLVPVDAGDWGVVKFQRSVLKEPKEGIRAELREKRKKKRRKRKKVVKPPVRERLASGFSTVPGVFETDVNWNMVGRMADHVLRMLGRR